MDTTAPVAARPALSRIRVRAWPRVASPAAYVARLSGVAVAALVIAYLGICFRYADTLSRVAPNPLDHTAAYVAATHEDVIFRTADGLALRGWWFPA